MSVLDILQSESPVTKDGQLSDLNCNVETKRSPELGISQLGGVSCMKFSLHFERSLDWHDSLQSSLSDQLAGIGW
jgi:hypothetical protein